MMQCEIRPFLGYIMLATKLIFIHLWNLPLSIETVAASSSQLLYFCFTCMDDTIFVSCLTDILILSDSKWYRICTRTRIWYMHAFIYIHSFALGSTSGQVHFQKNYYSKKMKLQRWMKYINSKMNYVATW